jgi:hypothetical protein
MQSYIRQLLEDIEYLIKNPPPAPYIEIPPHMAEMPDMAELALNPPTTLALLTGIPFEAFPNFFDLKKKQWEVLADALKRLLDALNFQIIDLPENYPDDALYDLIVMHWDDTVQYLPLAGYELEFCTGDPDTCPYGEDCTYCFGEFPDDEFDEDGEMDVDNEPDDDEDFFMPEPGFVSGLFNDDGTPIDPLKIPIPDLCLRCNRYLSDDWEDDIFCTLNRNDQKDSEEFECGAFG